MRLIDADEMVLIESEAYVEAQLKVNELTRKVNEVVHMKLLRLIADTPTAGIAPQWIPCKDRYPDEDVVVLAYTVNIDSQRIEILVAYWNNEEGWCLNFSGENLSEYYIDVTHWMPFPAPPVERKDGE